MKAGHSGNKTPNMIITFHLIKLEETSDKGVQPSAFLYPPPQKVVDLGEAGSQVLWGKQ